MLSPKQSAIIDALRKHSTMSLTEITRLVGGNVYHNADKHTGALLSNMVRRGMIERVKPRVFKLAPLKLDGVPEHLRDWAAKHMGGIP